MVRTSWKASALTTSSVYCTLSRGETCRAERLEVITLQEKEKCELVAYMGQTASSERATNRRHKEKCDGCSHLEGEGVDDAGVHDHVGAHTRTRG